MTTSSTQTIASAALSPEEVKQFKQQGYLGPYTLCSPEEMASILQEVDRDVLASDPPFKAPRRQSRHLDKRVVWELCSHPAVVNRMQCLYGADLILWRSCFFDKEPGSKAIPWHQDNNYWPIEPAVNITAWIALTPAIVENSCVQIIPGSHRFTVPHVKADSDKMFGEEADPAYVDLDKVVNMELKPGEFFIFNERLLHHSHPNTSTMRRCGLAMRVTVPFVHVEHEKLFAGHKCIQLSGRDPLHFNQMAAPPVS